MFSFSCSQGRAKGNRLALVVRARVQLLLFTIGCNAQKHCGKVVLLGIVAMCVCGIGLDRIQMETNAEKLWVEAGGRLEEELAYTKGALGEGFGASQELIIQTPNIEGTNILTPNALLLHLEAVRKATKVTVTIDNKKWTLKELCYAPNLPEIENKALRPIFDLLVPCAIISPLDCFWEGAKIHGPEKNISFTPEKKLLKWTTLNPIGLLDLLKIGLDIFHNREYETIRTMFKEAGITSGYTEKPCLNPNDRECPRTAPNYRSKEALDIGASITDGCTGFAAKYMKWPEELIAGGVKKNRSGTIRSAGALQSIILLMGPQNMQRYYQDNDGQDLSTEKATQILEAWQRQFSKVMNAESSRVRDEDSTVLAFTSTAFNDLLKDFSKSSTVQLAIGYIIMVLYAGWSLKRWTNGVQSHGGLGVAGVILVTLSVVAGMGLCSFCGIAFNAASTQVLPFLALGLGVDDMFLIAHTYAAMSDIHPSDQVGYALGSAGVSVLLTSFNNMVAFLMAAIIPIPALRAFSIQAAVIVVFNYLAVTIVFPAMIAIDVKRKQDQRYDLLCCFSKTVPQRISVTPDLSTDTGNSTAAQPPYIGASQLPSIGAVVTANGTISLPGAVTVHAAAFAELGPKTVYNTLLPLSVSELNNQTTQSMKSSRCERKHGRWHWLKHLSLEHFADHYYGPCLQKNSTKILVLFMFAAMFGAGVYGCMLVRDGLDLMDVVPRNTTEHKFVDAQSKYFSYYIMYAVTKEYDYPNGQKLMYKYHEAFSRVRNIIKSPDIKTQPFWLIYFRDWLKDMQQAFDSDWSTGCVTYEGWRENASDYGILGYKLLSQTGNPDMPINRTQVRSIRLVDESGIIRPASFYNYLTAWMNVDTMGYTASQAFIKPEAVNWYNLRDVREQHSMRMEAAKPITFAQLPFDLFHLKTTEDIVQTIKEVRKICDEFQAAGLPSYPSGIPFTFWEQYIMLRQHLMVAIIIVLGITFIVIAGFLWSVWTAIIIDLTLVMITVQLFGFMGLAGIKLSAVPAVTLILSVGVGVEFTVHMCMAFLTSTGDRNHRMQTAIEHVFTPIVDGAVSTLLGVIMLAGSEFDFIVRYFFHLLAALIVIGSLNGLMFLPVLLSFAGPHPEV
ncbi:predicted protein, partial [Nematostella vectensis]